MGAFEEMIIGSPEFRAEVRDRLATPPRWPVLWWIVLAIGAPIGALLLGWGVAHLRPAHLYRQSTGEGLQFAVIGFAYCAAHGLFASVGYAIVRLRAGSSPVSRLALLWLGIALGCGLVLADALAIWVSWHGDRCIGPCGPDVWPPF